MNELIFNNDVGDGIGTIFLVKDNALILSKHDDIYVMVSLKNGDIVDECTNVDVLVDRIASTDGFLYAIVEAKITIK